MPESTTEWANFHVVWKECLGARNLGKLKFAWVVPKESPVIGVSAAFVSLLSVRIANIYAEFVVGKEPAYYRAMHVHF